MVGKETSHCWQRCLSPRKLGCSHMHRAVVNPYLALCMDDDTDWHLSVETDKAIEGEGKWNYLADVRRFCPLFAPLLYSLYSNPFHLLSVSPWFFFLSSESLSSRLLASCCQNHSVCADVFCSDAGLSIDLVGARARRATLLRKPHRRRRTRYVRVPTAAVTFAPLLPQKTRGGPIRVQHACRLLLL